jgi:hypothetical protein
MSKEMGLLKTCKSKDLSANTALICIFETFLLRLWPPSPPPFVEDGVTGGDKKLCMPLKRAPEHVK